LKGDGRAAQLEAINVRRQHRSMITETADILAEMRDGGGWSEDSHPRDDKGMFAAGSGGKDGSSTKAGSISNKTAAAAETLAWKVAHNPGDAEPGAEHNALGDAHMAVANAATAAGKSDIASAHTAAANAHYAAAEAWDKHDEQHGMEDTPSDASKASREGAVKLTNSAQHASEHASDVTAGFAPSQDEAKKGK
jgi:hypothetical protein